MSQLHLKARSALSLCKTHLFDTACHRAKVFYKCKFFPQQSVMFLFSSIFFFLLFFRKKMGMTSQISSWPGRCWSFLELSSASRFFLSLEMKPLDLSIHYLFCMAFHEAVHIFLWNLSQLQGMWIFQQFKKLYSTVSIFKKSSVQSMNIGVL